MMPYDLFVSELLIPKKETKRPVDPISCFYEVIESTGLVSFVKKILKLNLAEGVGLEPT